MAFHLYDINELYSNANGTIQFIELVVGTFNGEHRWMGHSITVTQGASEHSFTFPSDLPSSQTANTSVLIATQGFADLGVVKPDFIVPPEFLFVDGGIVNFAGVDNVTYTALPTNGSLAWYHDGTTVVNTPTNFAGSTGTVSARPPGGTDGADDLAGTAGNDIFSGGAGSDTVNGHAGDDTLNGGADDDTLYGGDGSDTIRGGDGNDTIVGQANVFDSLPDVLDGGAGDDTFYAEASDSVQGDAGRDLLYIVNSNPININLGAASIEWVQSEFGNDIIDGSSQTVGIEIYSDGGNDTITGSAFNDIIWSGSGDDTVSAGGGNDVVVADIGVDTLAGGEGNDRLYIDAGDSVDGGAGFDAAYITGGAGMTINMAATNLEWAADFTGGNDILDGSASSSPLEIYAAGGTDSIIGGTGSDFLWGGSSDDTVSGNAGDDTLVGETGSDTLTGGTGIDALYGNSGNGGDGAVDTFVFIDNWGIDFVFDFDNDIDKLDVSAVSGLNSIADVTVTNTAEGHAYVQFGIQLIAVASASGMIDSSDFVF